MTALAQDRARSAAKWTGKQFTLASGNKAYKNAKVAINPGTGKVVVVTAASGLQIIGSAAEQVDATNGDLLLNVEFDHERILEWMVNGTAGDAVAATDLGSLCWSLDDQTVSILPAAKSPLGRIWGVDSVKGVLIERLDSFPTPLQCPVVGAYTANDYAPATIIHDAIYDVPATGAASTITLPAAAPDGTRAMFAADGTKNGNTVQYRDGTGPVNLTTALVASKRHLVLVEKRGGLWFANAYVSP